MKKVAFTLAEVLITLAVVGVISAMTLPILISKIQDRQFDRARQKALSSIGEAGKIIAIKGRINEATNAEDFVKNYLSENLKIIKFCGTTPTNCGFSETITKMGKSGNTSIPTQTIYITSSSNKNKSFAFLTANGYSVNIFYNQSCSTNASHTRNKICFNAIYDMNGKKGPNEVGRDIGWVTVIGNDESVVAVSPAFDTNNDTEQITSRYKYDLASKTCSDLGYRLPTWQELESVVYNNDIVNFGGLDYYSNSLDENNKHILVYVPSGSAGWYGETSAHYIRCVKK